MVCTGNTPPKGPYTAHEPQRRVEQGFARPYGIPYGILAVLVEYRTVLNGRAKSGGVLGDRRARDGCSRRPTVESLRPYGGSSCAFANDQSPGKGEPHRRLRSRNLVCSEPWGFQYGLAKSRTENRQVMGCVGNSYGDCRCGPPLPDELQKSWKSSVVRFCLENEFAGAARTVDRFRLLGNYSIVLISTHGNRHFQNFRHPNWDPGSSQPEYSDWRPAIWTWELLTETNAKRYAYDLQTG